MYCNYFYIYYDNLHTAHLIVSLSQVDRLFGSMILARLCHSYNILFQLLEENISTFVKNELKKIQKVLHSGYSECSVNQREDEEVIDGEDGEQRSSSREAFLKITLHFLRRMKQQELADYLQSSKRSFLNSVSPTVAFRGRPPL